MIKLRNQVPTVYTNASRDFQYLSWLIDIVLNSVKHNVDDMYQLPNVAYDAKMSELLSMTLGFKVKRNYDQKQLAALVSILPSILKYKGTIRAIEMAAEALITASGALGDIDCSADGTQLTVVLPKDLIDTTLFLDLLDYILPAGMTCRVIRENRTKRTLDNIYVRHSDTVRYEACKELDGKYGTSTGLATMFGLVDPTNDAAIVLTPETYTTANFKQEDSAFVLNTGILDNTVIPVVPGKEIIVDDSVELRSTEVDTATEEVYHKVLYAASDIKLRAKRKKQDL